MITMRGTTSSANQRPVSRPRTNERPVLAELLRVPGVGVATGPGLGLLHHGDQLLAVLRRRARDLRQLHARRRLHNLAVTNLSDQRLSTFRPVSHVRLDLDSSWSYSESTG